MRLRSLTFLPALLLVGSGITIQAQTTTGSLTMVVTDRATGEPLKGARIVLTSPAIFKARTYQADDRGQIQAVLLPVGNYSAMVSQSGFLSAQVTDMRIGLGAKMSTNVDLAPFSSMPGAYVTTIAASVEVDGGTDFSDSPLK